MLETILKICCGLVLAIIVFSPVMGCDVDRFCKINESDNITISIFNITTGVPIDSATVKMDIWLNDAIITNQNDFIYLNNGIYYYTLNGSEINTTGKRKYYINVTYDIYGKIENGEYQIMNETPSNTVMSINTTINTISSDLTYVNSTVWDIMDSITDPLSQLYNNVWGYLNRTLTQAVTVSQSDVEHIAQTTWNKTVVGTTPGDVQPHWYLDKYGNLRYGVPP